MHSSARGRYDFPPAVADFTNGAPSSLNLASPTRFLASMIASFGWVVPAMTLAAASWLVPASLTPMLLGRAIDSGIVAGNTWATLGWCAALLGVIAYAVISGLYFHTFAVREWLLAIYGTQRRVGRKAAQLGHVLPRRIPTGEVLSVTSSDVETFGGTIDALAGAIAATVSFLVVTALMLTTSPTLGLLVLVVTPLIVLSSLPLLRPLHLAQQRERSESSTLTSQASDIVAGLRILRGVGGERTFASNYERQSQKVRGLGIRLGTWQGAIEALSIGLSGLLLTALVYLGAQQLLNGQLTVGQLIAFFGYAIFLLTPVQMIFDFAQRWAQALVAAARAIALFRPQPPWKDGGIPVSDRPCLFDESSQVKVHPGQLLGIVSADPNASAALADRLGCWLPPVHTSEDDEPDLSELKGRALRQAQQQIQTVRDEQAAADMARSEQPWGVSADGIDYRDLSLASLRNRIVMLDPSSMLFAGTLQEAIDPWESHTREQAEQALVTASAEDIYAALPGGWQGVIEEQGRGLSGGQRQRLMLARALLLDPEVLILVEPTSAVDAHTEARIAQRLAAHRRGRTTVVVTASPLLLRQCDEVVLLADGRQVARGTHLTLRANPAYREVVSRGMEDDDA